MKPVEILKSVVTMLERINPPKINSKDTDYCDYFCPHLDKHGAHCNLFNHYVVEQKITENDFKRCPNCYKFTKLME